MERAAEVLVVDLRQAWPVLLVRAVFAVALGMVALIWPTITLLVLAWAFGIYPGSRIRRAHSGQV
jgi:uncharacterized membrane protein HdeD (DUF308 family)